MTVAYSCLLGGLQVHQEGVYKLEKTTRGNRQVSHRKIEATNPFVEGTYTVSAVRENVMETVAVYVYAPNPGVLKTRIKAVTDILDQVNYTIVFSTNGYSETWTCQVADYQINEQHEFQHESMALISASVPRLPTVVFA